MMFKVAAVAGFLALAKAAAPVIDISDDAFVHEASQSIVDYVNSANTTWTAGHNPRFVNTKFSDIKTLCGVKEGGPLLAPLTPTDEHLAIAADPPASFDSRTKWGSICPSTEEIRDQAACGSCWAVSAVEAQTDRTCIASNGANKPHLSAQDMNSCCSSCGDGCGGGYPSAAWSYWKDTGVVTGANYDVKPTLCDPYTIPSCDHHIAHPKITPCGPEGPTPACKRSCVNGDQWEADKHHGSDVYSLDMSTVYADMMKNGPIQSSFTVYSDFPSYTGGVYKRTSNQPLGGHAIKIIGWGEENGTPYWLVANSWNKDWGMEGLFKIVRGSDECGIEQGFVAGTV